MITIIVYLIVLLITIAPLLCSAQVTGNRWFSEPHSTDSIFSARLRCADTVHGPNFKIMTKWVADSSIAVINAAVSQRVQYADSIIKYVTPKQLRDSAYLKAITTALITAALGFMPADAATVATNTSNIAGNTTAIGLRKLISDSGTCIGCYVTGYDLKKSKDSVVALIPSITGLVASTRTISTTSPLTGGGDLSANRTISINNAAADGSTKGAASFNTEYFDDNGSGIISLAFLNGTGTVSANAVTINATKGKITYTSPSISAGNAIGVTLTNSYISASSIITVNINSNGSTFATNIQCYIKSQTSGSCVINVANLSLLSLFNSTFLIDFMVIN